jgi:uncharacterized heparinase superfamily protein
MAGADAQPAVSARQGRATAGVPPGWRLQRLGRLWRTARYIPPAQLAARARVVALRRLYTAFPQWPIRVARRRAAGTDAATPAPLLPIELIVPEGLTGVRMRAGALADGQFSFIGRTVDFSGGVRWRDAELSPLWMFNLHYLGTLTDLMLAGCTRHAAALLASWCEQFADAWNPVAWHPYPTAQRLMHLCIASAAAPADGGGFASRALRLAAVHAAYLLQHLEYDLRGNHLLEDACALAFASRFLSGPLAHDCEGVARRLLAAELPEQILADGGHFELSPMYHVIVMQRLLQVMALLGADDPLTRNTLAPAVTRMAHFLEGILCPDGDLPTLGDSVRDFAPPPAALLAAARRYGCNGGSPAGMGRTSFVHSGMHVLRSPRLWALLDAGPVCPDYLPGHGQADSLTVEVWCDGACIVGDPGVFDYTGAERAWGRSSRAHSTVTVDDRDTSEVYDSFRVGARAHVGAPVLSGSGVEVCLDTADGRASFTRRVRLCGTPPSQLEIGDVAVAQPGATVRARLHLHPAVRVLEPASEPGHCLTVQSPAGRVRITAAHPLSLEAGRASRQFGALAATTIVVQVLRPAAAGVFTGSFSITPLS